MTEQLAEISTQQPDLPPAVRRAYDISDDVVVERLSGGLVNDTLLVRDQGERTIMRRLSPILGHTLLQDAEVVGNHLIEHGWEAPSNLPTVDGDPHTKDEAGLVWHRMPFIASDGKSPAKPSTELSAAAGTMIGGWHATVRKLDYVPRFSIPNFHNTEYYAAKLTDQLTAMPDRAAYTLAGELLNRYSMLPEQDDKTSQLIHGDPKLDNMLFRDGKPFTLIDFDTVMHGSRWLDVGDFLRSITGKLLVSESAGNASEAFIQTYHEAGELDISVDEATHRAHRATGQIALELGMRYLSDIVDKEKYFSWDPSRHNSRRDNHLERTELQLQVAELALKAT